MHPASEDAGDPRCLWNKRRDIAQQWPLGGVIRRTDSGFDYGALGFIESAADGSAEVDRIRRGRPQPGLVPAIRGPKVEDVERVARTQGQLHVDTAEAARKVAVLMLGIDDVHLNAAAKRSHEERRQQIGLSCP